MDEKEVVQIVEICIPDPEWEHGVPGEAAAIFGKHLWTTTKGLTDTYDPCGGNLRFEAVPPSERIIGRSGDEPIMIQCNNCGHTLSPFAASWNEAVRKWQLIAYIAGLVVIQCISYLRGQKHLQWDLDLNTFFPKDSISFSGPLQSLLVKKYDFWRRLKGKIIGLPFWQEYGLAVAYVTNIDQNEGLEKLLVVSGYLLKQMEESFQKAIERGYQLAGSGSEFFHPRPRRKRT